MKLGVGKHALAVAALGVMAAATPAAADTASEIRALKAQLRALEAKVAKQAHEVHHATNVANAAAHGKGDPAHPAPPPVFVSFKNGLFVETEDKAFSIGVNGRVHVDGGFQSEPETGNSSNVLLRRARLDVAGKAFKYWYYRTQFEFGGSSSGASSANVRDAWMGFKYPILAKLGLGYEKDIFIQVGNQLRPLGLEAMSTSNSGTTFIERTAMSDAFNTPTRHLGVSVSTGDKNWGVKTGFYSTSPQDAAIRPPLAGSGQYWEVAGRAVYLPIRTEEDLLHFGISGRYYRPNGATGASDNGRLLIGRGIRNEANVFNTNMLGVPDMSCAPTQVSTSGSIFNLGFADFVQQSCLKSVAGFNAEFLAVHGPFSIQAEYAQAHYNRDANTSLALLATNAPLGTLSGSRLFAGQGLASSATFDGWYAQAAVFLTGETRITAYTDIDHNVNTPWTFSTQPKILNPISKGGYGAFEVAARWSAINLNSGSYGPWNYLGAVSNGFAPGTSVPAALRLPVLLANSSATVGGRVNQFTVGLNWYPEKGYRFLFNYSHVMNNVAPFDRPFLAGNHTGIFLTRAEVWW